MQTGRFCHNPNCGINRAREWRTLNGFWYCTPCAGKTNYQGYLRVPHQNHHIFRKIGLRSKPNQKIRDAAINKAIVAKAHSWPYQYDPTNPYPPPPRPTSPQCLLDQNLHAKGCTHTSTEPQRRPHSETTKLQQSKAISDQPTSYNQATSSDQSTSTDESTSDDQLINQAHEETSPTFRSNYLPSDIHGRERERLSAPTLNEADYWRQERMDVDPSPPTSSSTSPPIETNPFQEATNSIEDAQRRYHNLQARHYDLQTEFRELEAEHEELKGQLQRQQALARVFEAAPNTCNRALRHNNTDVFAITGAERRLLEVVRGIEDPLVVRHITAWECMNLNDRE